MLTSQVGANLKDVCTKILSVSILVYLVVSCINPFAPELDSELSDEKNLIQDRKTIDGVFANFQYAYNFKDTTIYGELLAEDYSFLYRDYELSADVSWGRDEEMKVTNGLFQNSQRLDLVWNNILLMSSDSTNVVRSFNLTITFNPTDVVYIDGRVNLDLQKDIDNKWQILKWVDESNF